MSTTLTAPTTVPVTGDEYRQANEALFTERGRLLARRATLESAKRPNKRLIDRVNRQIRSVDDRIVEVNRPLAVGYARRFVQRADRFDADDIFAAGILGLVESVSRYDMTKGPFAQYARLSIKRRVSETVNALDYPELSKNDYESRPRVLQVQREIAELKDRPATVEEIAEECGFPVQQVARIINPAQTASLSTPLDSYGDTDATLEDRLVDDSDASTIDDLFARMTATAFERWAPQILSPQEMYALVRHHGIDGDNPDKFEDIGAYLGGVSREAARQCELRALSQLSHPAVLRVLLRGEPVPT